MRMWGKMACWAALPLMLGGCLWGPGKFSSNLALNRAGSFVLDYRGEIMLQMPEDKPRAEPWQDSMASCHVDGRIKVEEVGIVIEPQPASGEGTEDPDELRTCTPAELARLRADYEKKAAEQQARQRKESEEMARLFGLPGMDDESNQRFAANLAKHRGWRSVTYKGKGVFDVDYHFEGRLDQDFAFPLMPDSDLMVPFITIRPRTDGSVKVTAPALVGGGGVFSARAKAMGMSEKGGDGPPSRAEGRFTIVTDGEILTNNSEDGPVAAPGGRKVQWDVGPGSQKVPEMLVKL